MSCFSLDFWFRVFVAIILIIALWQIMRLFLPYLTNRLPALVVQILNILIWAGIAILSLIVIFFFLSCIWGLISSTFGGGLSLPHSSRSDLPFHLAAMPLLFWRHHAQLRLPRS